MCGIVGYISEDDNAIEEAINILKKLEYRGYDSAGLAYVDKNHRINIKKSKGRIAQLEQKINKKWPSHCVIAHTRWATHGEPNEINAHPHIGEKVVLVQNGIIENYEEVKTFLKSKNIDFYSQTDTEVITKLIDYEYNLLKDEVKAIRSAMNRVKGVFALVLMFDNKETLYAVSNDAPLVITSTLRGFVISSDVNSISNYKSNDFWFLTDGEIAIIENKSIKFINSLNEEFKKQTKKILSESKEDSKNGYESFMLKEIYEQTNVLTTILKTHISDENKISFKIDDIDVRHLSKFKKIRIIGCGSAYNSGLNAKYFFENLAGIKTEVLIASEFRYSAFIKEPSTLNIVISQSGETADTIASLRQLKKHNEKVLAVVNNKFSTVANEADYVLLMQCGVEYSVASTKSYTSTTFLLHLLAFKIGMLNKQHKHQEIDFINQAFAAIYSAHDFLDEKCVKKIVSKLAKFKNIYFIGRCFNCSLCYEAALKMKELTYINCNAYPAGELKHGAISLIDDKALVIAIMCNDDELINQKTYSNICEVSARKGNVVLIGNSKYEKYMKDVNSFLNNNANQNLFSYLSTIYLFQLISYYTTKALGNDIDNPRNLAKSVTVE